MAATNLNDFFSRIEEDFVELSKKAAKNAAMKAQDDIKQKADQFIANYYEYKTRYKRKRALYKLVERHYEERNVSDGIVIEFGVVYNPSNISGIHQSNSWYHQRGTKWIPRESGDFDFDSQNNGIPDATWITQKFWEGIHPSGLIGDDGGTEDKYGSPDKRMQEFFDGELDKKISTYLSDAMFGELEKYF